MMRWPLIVLLLVCGARAPAAQESAVRENCRLSGPPANAGEDSRNGTTLRVYPRARDISGDYTGCQTTWMQVEGGWALIWATIFEHGNPVRMAFPQGAPLLSAYFACTYERGKVVKGDLKNCLPPELLVTKSLPPGCLARIRVWDGDATAQWPLDCVYDEWDGGGPSVPGGATRLKLRP